MALTEDKARLIKKAGGVGLRLFAVRSAYLVWRELGLHTNSRVDPEASKAYLGGINTHKGFFVPVINALDCYLPVELDTIINQSGKDSFQQLIKGMRGIGKDYQSEFLVLIKKHSDAIKKINTLRDKVYAHKDRKVNLSMMTMPSVQQYDELFEDLQNFFNRITSDALDHSTWFFQDKDMEAQADTHLVMDNLLRGEAQRINEIDVELHRKLFEDGRRHWEST